MCWVICFDVSREERGSVYQKGMGDTDKKVKMIQHKEGQGMFPWLQHFNGISSLGWRQDPSCNGEDLIEGKRVEDWEKKMVHQIGIEDSEWEEWYGDISIKEV